ncbi:hypothetical protein ILYODFUR_012412 [Ilyodon furcidens]|uniref:Uncharacterized protein n=1 Tax=Ilyodon furcidens TaxID=33524 RepID=A0ABV0TU01_9TELE
MLKRRVNHDSPTTSKDLRYSGWISSTPEALPPRSFLTTSVTSAWMMKELLCPLNVKLQTGHFLFAECTRNSCPVNRFPHLSCDSLQLLQSYHGPFGYFSDYCSP